MIMMLRKQISIMYGLLGKGQLLGIPLCDIFIKDNTRLTISAFSYKIEKKGYFLSAVCNSLSILVSHLRVAAEWKRVFVRNHSYTEVWTRYLFFFIQIKLIFAYERFCARTRFQTEAQDNFDSFSRHMVTLKWPITRLVTLTYRILFITRVSFLYIAVL